MLRQESVRMREQVWMEGGKDERKEGASCGQIRGRGTGNNSSPVA
jgi:hypothetical protein